MSKMYKISDIFIKLITIAMKDWKVNLTLVGQPLTEVKLQRGIFQGDVLSQLFVAIIPLSYILGVGATNLVNPKKRLLTLCTWRISKYLQKNEKELKILIQTIRKYSQDLGKYFHIKNVQFR